MQPADRLHISCFDHRLLAELGRGGHPASGCARQLGVERGHRDQSSPTCRPQATPFLADQAVCSRPGLCIRARRRQEVQVPLGRDGRPLDNHRMRLVHFAALVSLGGAMATCGDADRLTEEEFCPAYAEAECATIGRWCAAEESECISARSIACQLRTTVAKRAKGAFNPGRAASCVAKVKSVHAKATVSSQNLRALEESCRRVYQAEKGAPCESFTECQDGLACRDSICSESRLPAGWCQYSSKPCGKGERCEQRGCIPRGELGFPCLWERGESDECQEQLRCFGGKCSSRAAIDEICAGDWQCELPSAYCHPHSMTCALGLTFGADSIACLHFRSGL